jgi:hypothetical protein
VILPYEGQHSLVPTEPVAKSETPHYVGQTVTTNSQVATKPVQVVERKKVSLPGLKISTNNLGINSILNPPKKQSDTLEATLPDLAENFTHAELMAVWNSYALDLKRERKDKLAATLTGASPILTSDYQITLEISNSAQAIDLEKEKVNLLGHLRSTLKNYQISFNYKVSTVQKFSNTDTKSTFEKLAEENPSLHKFRKLFNLDIDF